MPDLQGKQKYLRKYDDHVFKWTLNKKRKYVQTSQFWFERPHCIKEAWNQNKN